jgi:hypothetical protein
LHTPQWGNSTGFIDFTGAIIPERRSSMVRRNFLLALVATVILVAVMYLSARITILNSFKNLEEGIAFSGLVPSTAT